MALSAITLYSYKKKSQGPCGGESNQLSSFFFFFIFLCLKRHVAKSFAAARIHAHLPASGYLTEQQPLDHFSTLRKWLLQTVEAFLNHRKRRGNGSRTDRASVPTPTFLDDVPALPAILMFMCPSSSRFSALRSRWTMLRLWQYSTADRICQNFLRASTSLSRPCFAR